MDIRKALKMTVIDCQTRDCRKLNRNSRANIKLVPDNNYLQRTTEEWFEFKHIPFVGVLLRVSNSSSTMYKNEEIVGTEDLAE